MRSVNALKVRTKFGEVMDELNETGEPILLRRGSKVEAALVPIALFRERFVDALSQDELRAVRERVRTRRVRPKGDLSTLATLRRLRGYDDQDGPAPGAKRER
ncbi:MAG: type II toxin-antitoxin system Phd/YefM family antitoxin [Deltaproteobacteria bacterium]|nr:type II toxin-antitoxin system Phd/YefM family antitoxin [Deltaproteobacteria bacterium]